MPDDDQPRDAASRTPPKAAPASPADGAPGLPEEGDRIAKFLARAGVCSRRDAERLIAEGRVSVNGVKLATPAVKVDFRDDVRVDGKRIREPEPTRLWRFHKPAGCVTTNNDPQGRPTVFDRLPEGLPRVVTVGRLDLNSEGLLLLTNDGALARKLELPANAWMRRYRVRAHGAISQAELDGLASGIVVDGVTYGAIEAVLDRQQGGNAWLTMTIREGKNREIRRVLEAMGLKVNRLIRTAYGPFELGLLKPGQAEEAPARLLKTHFGPARKSGRPQAGG